MLALALLLAAPDTALTLAQAKALVLTSPGIEAAVRERKARPFFEYVEARPGGWYFTVNARNRCAHPHRPCSTLLGHFFVHSDIGWVVDLDAGEEGRVVSTPLTRKLRADQHKR